MSDALRSLDLFAGCGGLSLGLHLAGWQGVFAVERDPMAFETLQTNLVGDSAPYRAYEKWPDWLPVTPHDIDSLLADDGTRSNLRALRGQIDLVAGGPPCQGFSVGGIRNGADLRNRMVDRQLEFVELVQPRAVLIENVIGITRPFKSRPGEAGEFSVAADTVEKLKRLGYRGEFRVVNASEFGVPQVRMRALIVGFREDSFGEMPAFFEALREVRPEHLSSLNLPNRAITAHDALHDLYSGERLPCPDSLGYESSKYVKAKSAYAQLLRRGKRAGSTPDSHRYTKHGERILDLYETAHATQPKGRLSKSFLMSQATKKDKKVLIDPVLPVSTITTHPDEFIHFAEPRNITVREMARLQSFPDDFEFRGRYTINGPRRRFDVARCSQVGNAVPPLLARAIGLAFATLLSETQGTSSKE